MANGFRYTDGLKMFENRIHCIPAAGADLKAIAQEKLTWLDGLIAGRTYICGERLTWRISCFSCSWISSPGSSSR